MKSSLCFEWERITADGGTVKRADARMVNREVQYTLKEVAQQGAAIDEVSRPPLVNL
jgi:hypothetical protein